MGDLFAQVEKTFIEGPALSEAATQLSLDEDAVLGKVVRAWAWSIDHAAPEGLVAGAAAVRAIERVVAWTGKHGAFVRALPSVFEASEAGVRFRGWQERYGKMLRTRAQGAKRVRNHRANRSVTGDVTGEVTRTVTPDVTGDGDGPVTGDVTRYPSTSSTVLDLRSVSSSLVPLPKLPADILASGSAFFAWVQHERHSGGYATEKPPRIEKLNAFFSEFLMELGPDAERAKATFTAYVQDRDPYWRTRNFPFAGFMSEWRKYVPRKVAL